jgi:hypothetical protein
MSLVKGKNIDTNAITFSVPKSLDNGAKLVYVNYNQGRFSVQTPWMTMPWKMGAYTEGEFPKYSIDLSFKGMDENPDLQGFHDKFKALEQKLIDGGLDNSVAWFKKNIKSRDGVVEKFGPIIKESRDKETGEPDGKWPASMKVKVPCRDGVWECKVSNKDGTQYKWKLTKAEVDVPETFSNENFLDDSDEEEEVEHEFVKDSESDGEDAVDVANVEGSNSSGEVVAEPVEEPVKKKVVRKVVRKKPTNSE